MIFDTHAHLDDEKFDEDRDEIIQGLAVDRVLNAACDMKSVESTLRLCEKYDFIYGAVGVHPHSACEMCEHDLERIAKAAENPKIKAIGEIGLDYYYDFSPKQVQKDWFKRQLLLARELKMPVIIHDREAHGDCLDILRDFADLKVVYHCYSGSVEYSRELIALGFYISFTGSITFKNATCGLRVIAEMPRERIMIETDSPYLAPVPHRGERNTPSNVISVAEKIAETLGVTTEYVTDLTYDNANRFFQI